ncbi:hypothetical protein HAV15_009069 [Penicillium sp. str. |nr:hypothetical protein HAV15_009069 [Penicillium sp. str. \
MTRPRRQSRRERQERFHVQAPKLPKDQTWTAKDSPRRGQSCEVQPHPIASMQWNQNDITNNKQSRPKSSTASFTILIILSNAHTFPLRKTSSPDAGKIVEQPSGFFLQELAKPLQKLLDAGHEVTFASPKGQEPTSDPNSESLLAYAGNFNELQREQDLIERMRRENGLTRPRPFSTINDNELATFAGVFIPGGHVPLQDLGANAELGRILRYLYQENKSTAAICHGPYALLSTKEAGDGSFVYDSYKITSWSDAEENVMESLWGGEAGKVESALRDAGAVMVEGAPEKIGGKPLAANASGSDS